MCLVVCQRCGKESKVTVGNMLGEVICSKCNSYLGEIFEIADDENPTAPIEKVFVVPLIEEDEVEKARGTIPRFEEIEKDRDIN